MTAPETHWRNTRIAIIDLETTGLDPALHRVVEVGVVVVERWAAVERHGWLVYPGDIPAEATAVHGITNEDVAGKPRFHEVARDIEDAIGDALPVGFNGRFDRAFLLAEWLRCDACECGALTPPPFLTGGDRSTWLDVLVWARAHSPYARGKGRHKLGAVAERLGASVGTAHRAVGDCETTASVLAKLQALDMHPETFSDSVGQMPERWDDLQLHQKRLAALNEARFLDWLSTQPRTQATAT